MEYASSSPASFQRSTYRNPSLRTPRLLLADTPDCISLLACTSRPGPALSGMDREANDKPLDRKHQSPWYAPTPEQIFEDTSVPTQPLRMIGIRIVYHSASVAVGVFLGVAVLVDLAVSVGVGARVAVRVGVSVGGTV